jgi:hypothetical protein
VELIGYCLMSNHVHLVAVPRSRDASARSLKQTHGRFASYRNAVGHSSGHVWQGRYYSCPLDETHLGSSAVHRAQPRTSLPGGISPGLHSPGGDVRTVIYTNLRYNLKLSSSIFTIKTTAKTQTLYK